VLILADDLGYSDLGCFGSSVATPAIDALASSGLRFSQFYNCARCCPTRAALLTGRYPHQAGVGAMCQDWARFGPAYSPGLHDHVPTVAELLRGAGYRSYHVGKWHVARRVHPDDRNFPLQRGFDLAYGTGGGGNYFAPAPLYRDRAILAPGDDYYTTDAFTDEAVRFIELHAAHHPQQPFFLHLCYTAPHFPLQARTPDIARRQQSFSAGWDTERASRWHKQQALGLLPAGAQLSPRDPLARAWNQVPAAEQPEWALRMAVHAAMIDSLDQGVGRVLAALSRAGCDDNTLVLFLSDNGASAEALDSWPNPGRGHQPGSIVGTRQSHRCLEVGWSNAANTPFRGHKMSTFEGGIRTPLVARWPVGIKSAGAISHQVGHVIDLVPTLLDLAGVASPAAPAGRTLAPFEGRSLAAALDGRPPEPRTLAWEHEGHRAFRDGDWKVVALYREPWELYDLAHDPTETKNLAADQPQRLEQLVDRWQQWADRVGVVPWEKLPGSAYRPSAGYRRFSEPVPAP
jgi:arylsulfatase